MPIQTVHMSKVSIIRAIAIVGNKSVIIAVSERISVRVLRSSLRLSKACTTKREDERDN